MGDVFAGVGAGKIYHYNSVGSFIEELNTTSGSQEETGMCFDGGGNLYTTNWSARNMSKFDNQGGLLMHPWGSFQGRPESCVADAASAGGYIYTGEANEGAFIRKFNSGGALQAVYTPAVENREQRHRLDRPGLGPAHHILHLGWQ